MPSRADAAAAKARYDQGVAFAEQGKWDEALAAFRVAAEMNPEMSKAWGEIACCLLYTSPSPRD